MKPKNPDKYPCEDSFLKSRVASNQDATGFVPPIPQDDYEADSFMDLIPAPVTSLKKDIKDDDTKHKKCHSKVK